MAKRPVFVAQKSGQLLVKTEYVNFQWSPGMSVVQRRKCIESLHQAAIEAGLCSNPLEVSTKSQVGLGVAMSAFNLKITTQRQMRTFTVESAYQSSKVFRHGGPYRDLLCAPSGQAKMDTRLRESGQLIGFEFFGEHWELEPRTAFYDWVYVNALHQNMSYAAQIDDYDAFTDIEFNPERSLNCQAYSVALYKALAWRGLIDKVADRSSYINIIRSAPLNNSKENTQTQPRLL